MTEQEIRDNAPDGALLYYQYSKHFSFKVEYFKYFFNYLQIWVDGHGWFPCDKAVFEEGLKPL